jgi:hypothetical protein
MLDLLKKTELLVKKIILSFGKKMKNKFKIRILSRFILLLLHPSIN